jgi:hypothetical protein
MPRELSQAEKDYITKNHENMSAEEICADMPGVGPKTIATFIDSGIMPEPKRDETVEERREKVQKVGRTGLTAGKLMARDPKRGIAVMTQGASEMSDAMKHLNHSSVDKTAENNKGRIYVMDPKKKVH